MQFRVSPKALDNYSTEEWQARVDLAAAHRLAFNQGFSEGIFNHLTFVVPGRSDRYYQIPFGTHWSEVTASCFMEVGIDDGEVKRGEGEVERSRKTDQPGEPLGTAKTRCDAQSNLGLPEPRVSRGNP